MMLDTKSLSIIIIFAALYAVGVITFAGISFSYIQVRVADALLPLSMLFGIPSIIGLGLGTLVANVYGGLGFLDIIGGTVANLIGCTLAWYIAKRGNLTSRILGAFVETVTISVIVGSYLSILFELPLEISIFWIFLGSLIAITIIGLPFEEALQKTGLAKKYHLNSPHDTR